MPRIEVKGVEIAYDILGSDGPPVALTPSGPGPSGKSGRMDRTRPLAEGLSSLGYRVLIWDRRNTGKSGFGLEDADSEYDMWADDLHLLMFLLGFAPFYAGGGSSGYLTSVVTAYRHPVAVRGLLLYSPMTGDPDMWARIARLRHLHPAEVVAEGGMLAAADNTVWGDETESNQSSKAKLLATNPDYFIACMKRWADWSTSGRAHLGGLSDDEFSSINMPSLIIPGANQVHPPAAADKVHELITESVLANPEELLSPPEVERMRELRKAEKWQDTITLYAPIIDDFIQRVEKGEV